MKKRALHTVHQKRKIFVSKRVLTGGGESDDIFVQISIQQIYVVTSDRLTGVFIFSYVFIKLHIITTKPGPVILTFRIHPIYGGSPLVTSTTTASVQHVGVYSNLRILFPFLKSCRRMIRGGTGKNQPNEIIICRYQILQNTYHDESCCWLFVSLGIRIMSTTNDY